MSISNSNLGSDPIGKLLFKLAVPAITAQLINALYNIVDRMYIGRMPGGEGALALTGVGLTFPVIILISAFAALIGMGGAPHASIKMGENDTEGAEQILGNCFSAILIISVILTAFFLAFMEPLLMLFGASADTIGYAMSYLGIYVIGTICVQLTIGMNAFITGQGFAKTSMLTVMIGAVINIVLDPIFIFGLNMGVRGAAIATVLSQSVSAIWVLKFLFGKKTLLKIHPRNMKISWKIISPAIALGMAPFIMQSTESLVNIALNSSLQRLGGDVYVGAMTVIGSIMQVSMMPMQGLCQGGQPIISFNYGAKKPERVVKAFKLLITSTVIYSLSIFALIELFPHVFAGIFLEDPKYMEVTVWAIRIFFGGLFAMGAQIACQQTMVALGESKVSLMLALLRKIILLIPLIYILPPLFNLGVTGVFLSEPIADILATATTVTIFSRKFPKIMADLRNKANARELSM